MKIVKGFFKVFFFFFFFFFLWWDFSGKTYFPASPNFMLISEKTTGFVWFI